MLRRFSAVSDDLTPTAAVSGGISTGTRRSGGGYCSYPRIPVFATLNKPALFLQSGNRSSGSSGSSSPDSSETETPPSDVSPDAGFKKQLRDEASSGLDEVACQMVRDGYTWGLMRAFSGESERGADDVLKGWFSELDVDWVLGIGETDLAPESEPEWAAFDGLIQRWIKAVMVMVKVFDMTRSDLHDQSSGGQLGLPTVARETRSRSAPVTALARPPPPPSCSSSVSDGSESSYGTSDSSLSSSSSSSVASVREAMAAFSLAGTGTRRVGGMDEPQPPEAQFAEFAMESVLKMLAFADAVAGVAKTRENLLCALDVYASISDNSPVLLRLFSGLHKEIVSRKIQSVAQLLRDAIRAMIRDVKACLAAGDSLGIPPGGDIHKTTRCAMRDIKALLHGYGYLDVAAAQHRDVDGCMLSLDMEGPSSLSDLLVELIHGLEDLLVEKAKMYPDPGLRYMFLLNNSSFILQQVESMDDLPSLVPFRKQRIERYIERYIESSWLRVLSCLPSPSRDGWRHRSRRCSPSLVKFNSEFQRTYGAHKHWKVPCPQLRGRLREVVAARVVGEYSRRLASYPELNSSARYTPWEMEELLAEQVIKCRLFLLQLQQVDLAGREDPGHVKLGEEAFQGKFSAAVARSRQKTPGSSLACPPPGLSDPRSR